MSQDAPTYSPQIDRLLQAWGEGDPNALAELMPLVCDELRSLARSFLGRERQLHTLQATALVNEVYLRIYNRDQVEWKNAAQFFGFVANTMRRVLVDYARRRNRDKRGAGVQPISIESLAIDLAMRQNLDIVALDDALKDLTRLDPRQAEIVHLRFFIGLTVEETAAILEISSATVKREWKVARAWLYREISR